MQRDRPLDAAQMIEHNEQLDAADRERIRAFEAAQKEHNDKMLIRVTLFGALITALVTLIAGGAGFWAAWEAHETRINDERPFVAVDAVQMMPAALTFEALKLKNGDPLPVTTTLVDAGKSAAIHIEVQCIVRQDFINLQWTGSPRAVTHIAFLLPSRTAEIACPFWGEQNSPFRDSFVQIGVVYYEDSDGKHYTTPFCQQLTPNQQILHVGACNVDYHLPKLV
jgi:hypothetical protein